MRTLTVPEPRVDRRELDEVLSTYRHQCQRSEQEAEAAVAPLALPAPTTRSRTAPAQVPPYDEELSN
jgi:hypothetical protein